MVGFKNKEYKPMFVGQFDSEDEEEDVAPPPPPPVLTKHTAPFPAEEGNAKPPARLQVPARMRAHVPAPQRTQAPPPKRAQVQQPTRPQGRLPTRPQARQPMRAQNQQPLRSNSSAPHPVPDTASSGDGQMNAELHERAKHGRRQEAVRDQEMTMVRRFHSNLLAQYTRDQYSQASADSAPWQSCPEMPTAKELCDENEPWTETCTEDGALKVVVKGNKLEGRWPSSNNYLGAHFSMLREEAVAPLRDAVSWVKAFPHATEDAHPGGTIGIYSRVHIIRLTLTTRGLGVRVVFSLSKVGKQVRWEQSKRLTTGSLVVLSPKADMFRSTTKCIVATVAARPLDSLLLNPPEIDLFFANPNELEIDPNVEYVMVEERSSFFEAVKHTMVSLKKMASENFPLQKHLVEVKDRVSPPKYLLAKPQLDLSAVFGSTDGSNPYSAVNVLTDWPKEPVTSLDKSQQNALHHILSKRVAIVQGPPGTGKTFVSVTALKILIANMEDGAPPIIVACQTNHALDQLLRHVAEFEDSFARLGGRSKDTGVVKEHTLYNLRQKARVTVPHGMRAPARWALDDLIDKISLLLAPLEYGNDSHQTGLLNHRFLEQYGVLTPAQSRSLEQGDDDWHGQVDTSAQPLVAWMGKYIDVNKRDFKPDTVAFAFEEVDLEFEQLKELEAENCAADDDVDFETLHGQPISLWDDFVGQPSNVVDAEIERWLQKDDMWLIKNRHRGAVFNYLVRKVKAQIQDKVRQYAAAFDKHVIKYRAGGFEQDAVLLRQRKLIGMTTTGLSKYRALVASLCPKVVMIEEAAETMEAPVIAACVPTLEHLILVGDHKQLRPQCGVKALEKAPYHMNVSLFERLIINKLPYKMLKRQRRMIPEIRRLLQPIYKADIRDHSNMLDVTIRPPVPGMGGVNTFFYTHAWPDAVDEQMSSTNVREADMIIGFFDYLVSNGLAVDQITVLTFYNGQRKHILRKLRAHSRLSHMDDGSKQFFKVLTVDSYQGEENEVVLLSMVKNNDEGKIGFTGVENRICVALSRAKRGLYIFGNAELLVGESKIWSQVITIMIGGKDAEQNDCIISDPECRVVFHLPVQCHNHSTKVWIQDAQEWNKIDGGCELPCKAPLICGHICPLKCHPYGHDKVTCKQKCLKMLPCGHSCGQNCSANCECARKCGYKPSRVKGLMTAEDGYSSDSNTRSTSAQWKAFANGGHKQHDKDMADQRRERYLRDQATHLQLGDAASVAAKPVRPLSPPKVPLTTANAVLHQRSPSQASTQAVSSTSGSMVLIPSLQEGPESMVTATEAWSLAPTSSSSRPLSSAAALGGAFLPPCAAPQFPTSHRNRFKRDPVLQSGNANSAAYSQAFPPLSSGPTRQGSPLRQSTTNSAPALNMPTAAAGHLISITTKATSATPSSSVSTSNTAPVVATPPATESAASKKEDLLIDFDD